MSYIGTKPANQITDSTLIADGTITTNDLANGTVTSAKMGSDSPAGVSGKTNSATDFFQVPRGTTAQRPASPATGMIRFNTELNYLEEYRNNQWLPVSSVFSASGGTVTDVGGYRYHTFTSSGTFQILSGTASVDYLIVAGGGGGGTDMFENRSAGGGGAGGMVSGSITLTPNSYTVTIGAGGSGGLATTGSATRGVSGNNSSALGITCIGGGGGASHDQGGNFPGLSGGSGGGGTHDATQGAPGSGTSGQGNAGGGSGATQGGAGAQWLNGSFYAGGGGASASSGFVGGGGGGKSGTAVSGSYNGGVGGGGAGGISDSSVGGSSGTANTGGGGGAARERNAGNGGSGIVIIRYLI